MEQVTDSVVGFDASYLKPPSDVVNIKHSDYYIIHGEGKKAGRKVYHNVQFTAFEQQGIAQFKAAAQAEEGLVLPEDWTDIDSLKMCYSARYDIKKCMKQTKEHIDWRTNTNIHQLDEASLEILQSGLVYLLGRDKQYRPVFVLDSTKINVKKQGEENIMRACCVLQDLVIRNMFVDYHVENWVFIIDTGNMGIFDLPINALKMMISAMSLNYCACMDKVYVLNPSFGLKTSWSIVSSMMDSESAEKITMLKKDKFAVIQEKIDPQFLEEKFGGQLPNLTTYWPPANVYRQN